MEKPVEIASLSTEEKKRLRDALPPVMSAAADRVHYAEARRGTFTVIAGVLFAGGMTVLTLAASLVENLPFRWAAIAFALSSTVLSLLIWILYSRQTNRYPFTSATDTWKWFYRDALPHHENFQISWLSYLYFGGEKQRVEEEYANQLPTFAARLASLSDDDESLMQDIQQLYVLHINEKYKNMFLSHLRSLTLCGFMASVLVTVLAFICGWYLVNGEVAKTEQPVDRTVVQHVLAEHAANPEMSDSQVVKLVDPKRW